MKFYASIAAGVCMIWLGFRFCYQRIKFQQNPSITSSDIPLKFKNPV